MKGSLEFSLPDEEVEFLRALKAEDIAGALKDFRGWLRSERKYVDLSAKHKEFANKAWDKFHEIMGERGVGEVVLP